MIAQLNSKIHYDKKDEVKRVHDMVLQKGMLKTSIGQKYIKRLDQLSNGDSTQSQCIICENSLVNNSAICTTCLTKIQQLQTQKENVSQSPNNNTYQPETHIDLQAQISKENISQSSHIETYQSEINKNSQTQTSKVNISQPSDIDTYQSQIHKNPQTQTSKENICIVCESFLKPL